jgi:large subunit ribosomal protein L29
MNANDLRQKNREELDEELIGLRREQFNLRMQRATGQLVRSDQFGKVRRNIARIKTVIREQDKSKSKET